MGEMELKLPYYYHIWTYNPRFYSHRYMGEMDSLLKQYADDVMEEAEKKFNSIEKAKPNNNHYASTTHPPRPGIVWRTVPDCGCFARQDITVAEMCKCLIGTRYVGFSEWVVAEGGMDSFSLFER